MDDNNKSNLYEHFMWKEINEIPDLLERNLLNLDSNSEIDVEFFQKGKISNIKLISSGSSNNACQAGRFIFEEISKIPTTIEYASEFAHKTYILGRNTLVIGVSQSGKTADTLAALKKIKKDTNCHIVSITNIKPSPIYDISDSKILIGAGEETAVPATKSFTLQLLTLFNVALILAEKKRINTERLLLIKEDLFEMIPIIRQIIDKKDEIKLIAEEIVKKEHVVVLSRGINHAIAREGALKLKETCYIDANGYPAGEFMHGYMAILDKDVNAIVLQYIEDEFLLANILKLRQSSEASFYGLTMDPSKSALYNSIIELPNTPTKLTSVFAFVTCLQMIAYFGAVSLGYDPDKPRGLTKFLEKEK